MSVPDLSVVIPTRDRPERLLETIAALLEQRNEAELEIIIVDDGSSEDSSSEITGMISRFDATIRLERQSPSGPAAARNRGTALARAERILFLGDDTRPRPGTLKRHLDLAQEHGNQVGIQGHIDWDPERPITELMHFLAPAGPQFYFKGLRDGQPIPFTAVLGSNLSVPTAWLHREPFDEGFPFAAVEDTEAAWRWHRSGWQTIYAADAVCWHHHLYDDLEPFLARQRRAGSSAGHAVRLHPSLFARLVLQPTLFGLWVRGRRLLGRGRAHDDWDLACRRAFLAGFLKPAGPDL